MEFEAIENNSGEGLNPEQIIEALIFVSDGPLRPKQIVEIFEGEDFQELKFTEDEVAMMLEGIMEKYKSADYVFEIRRIDGGYQFFTKKEYYPYTRHAAIVKSKKRLSRPSLETLAVIAYRQPISKAEIEFIRGVNCDYALAKLLDKKLVEISGRANAPGRPLLYSTTGHFMEYFGLNSLSDLPRLEEFSMNEEEYKAQFRTFLEEREIEEAVKAGEINEDEAKVLREMREEEMAKAISIHPGEEENASESTENNGADEQEETPVTVSEREPEEPPVMADATEDAPEEDIEDDEPISGEEEEGSGEEISSGDEEEGEQQ